ncbi:non-heme ferritin [Pantoea sp. Mhis]|uniref:non-heme ferritin n=1 Tax=Pantoea sp. Mhis TaxID=2576759 RepID=UPI0013587BD9|nr:non-heme ferritin [Pantoea sp. Mhis]MXP56698.1 non-heme ferritin [Pantoea sp. Mhis]
MLSTEMSSHLNNQMNLEFYSANFYLQMSGWCINKGLEGSSVFFKIHSQEEMEHMQRFFNYLSDTGTLPIIGNIAAPPISWSSLVEILEEALKHEKLITDKINQLVHVAMNIRDYSTFNFLQWYVAEQHEEEKLLKAMLDKAVLVGNKGEGLFLIDKELGIISAKHFNNH